MLLSLGKSVSLDRYIWIRRFLLEVRQTSRFSMRLQVPLHVLWILHIRKVWALLKLAQMFKISPSDFPISSKFDRPIGETSIPKAYGKKQCLVLSLTPVFQYFLYFLYFVSCIVWKCVICQYYNMQIECKAR